MSEEDEELKEKIVKDVKQCIIDGQDKETCLDEVVKKHNLTIDDRRLIQRELEESEEGNNIPEEAVEKSY